MDLRDLDACLDRAFALTSSDFQREAERQRDAEAIAGFAGTLHSLTKPPAPAINSLYAEAILAGAIVGAPAVEE